MLTGFADVLATINKFRERELNFQEYKQRLLNRASLIGKDLKYESNWESTLDAWLELIEYFYGQEDWYELGCSLGNFIEYAIINEPRPLVLPKEDRVVREHFLKS